MGRILIRTKPIAKGLGLDANGMSRESHEELKGILRVDAQPDGGAALGPVVECVLPGTCSHRAGLRLGGRRREDF